MSSDQRKLQDELGRLGFDFDRRTRNGQDIYLHIDTGRELKLRAGRLDLRDAVRQARKIAGVADVDNKRDPAQIKARRDREREKWRREVEAAKAELAAVTARRAAGDSAVQLTAEAEARLREAERQFRYWDNIMREAASAA